MIDEKYLVGVWYDMMSGDFCRICEHDDGSVGLVTPDGEDEYHVFEDPEEFESSDYRRVPEDVIADPVGAYLDVVSAAVERAHLPFEDEVAFDYADRHVEVVRDE